MSDTKTFFMTSTGFALTMASGMISAASSALIIYIVLRSMQKLSTPFHRIMTFMSLCDIILSVSMALGTIPMPKDNIYKFDGPMLGTFSTCAAQAYVIFWSASTGATLNLFLSWYCVFDTTFKINRETVRRRMEPFFYTLAASFGILVPTLLLWYDLLNAHPFDPFCSVGPYPYDCNELKGTKYEGTSLECDEIDDSNYRSALNISSVIVFIRFFGVALAMIIIIWTALRNEMKINAEKKDAKENELRIELEQDEIIISTVHERENRTSIKRLQYNRVMVFQALMYIGAFFLTWVFVFVPHFDKDQGNDTTIFALQCVFRNLQGFWNMIIFVHLKTYLVLKHKDGATVWTALKIVIIKPRDVPEVYISNIDLVVDDNKTENDKKRENEFVFNSLSTPSEIISNASSPNSRLTIGSGFDSRLSESYSRLTLGSASFSECNEETSVASPCVSKLYAAVNEDCLPDSGAAIAFNG